MTIANLTQHLATAEQAHDGVVDLAPNARAELTELLTFDVLPNQQDITDRAQKIAALAAPHTAAMIGGAPYLMPALERALQERGCTPLYAFSQRVSVEAVQPDGSVRKVNVFQHLGFVRT